MANDKVFPEGIRMFAKRQGAPDFVIGSMVITPNALVQWLKDNKQYLSEYKGEKQLKLQVLSGKNGPYVSVDTYQPANTSDNGSDLPF